MTLPERIERLAYSLRLDIFNNNQIIKMISAKTKIKPIFVTSFIFFLILLFMFFTTPGKAFTEGILFFLYPAIKSYEAVRTSGSTDDMKWITYWAFFTLIQGINILCPYLISWLPLRSVLIPVFLGFLIHPRPPVNVFLQRQVVRPLIDKYDELYEEYINKSSNKKLVNFERRKPEDKKKPQ